MKDGAGERRHRKEFHKCASGDCTRRAPLFTPLVGTPGEEHEAGTQGVALRALEVAHNRQQGDGKGHGCIARREESHEPPNHRPCTDQRPQHVAWRQREEREGGEEKGERWRVLEEIFVHGGPGRVEILTGDQVIEGSTKDQEVVFVRQDRALIPDHDRGERIEYHQDTKRPSRTSAGIVGRGCVRGGGVVTGRRGLRHAHKLIENRAERKRGAFGALQKREPGCRGIRDTPVRCRTVGYGFLTAGVGLGRALNSSYSLV